MSASNSNSTSPETSPAETPSETVAAGNVFVSGNMSKKAKRPLNDRRLFKVVASALLAIIVISGATLVIYEKVQNSKSIIIGKTTITPKQVKGYGTAIGNYATGHKETLDGGLSPQQAAQNALVLNAALKDQAQKHGVSISQSDIDKIAAVNYRSVGSKQAYWNLVKSEGIADYMQTQFENSAYEVKLGSVLLAREQLLWVSINVATPYVDQSSDPAALRAQATQIMTSKFLPLFQAKESKEEIAKHAQQDLVNHPDEGSSYKAQLLTTANYYSSYDPSDPNFFNDATTQRNVPGQKVAASEIAKLTKVGQYTPVFLSKGGYVGIFRLEGKTGGTYTSWDNFLNSYKKQYGVHVPTTAATIISHKFAEVWHVATWPMARVASLAREKLLPQAYATACTEPDFNYYVKAFDNLTVTYTPATSGNHGDATGNLVGGADFKYDHAGPGTDGSDCGADHDDVHTSGGGVVTLKDNCIADTPIYYQTPADTNDSFQGVYTDNFQNDLVFKNGINDIPWNSGSKNSNPQDRVFMLYKVHWSLSGSSTVSKTSVNVTGTNGVSTQNSETVTFDHDVYNNGPGTASYTWQVMGCRSDNDSCGDFSYGGFAASHNGGDASMPGNTVNCGSGNNCPSPSNGDNGKSLYYFPSGVSNGTMYCQLITYPKSSSDSTTGHSIKVCVTLNVQNQTTTTQVTPSVSGSTPSCSQQNETFTASPTTGVNWSLTSKTLSPQQSYTFTATPQSGYTFTGSSPNSYSYTATNNFNNSSCTTSGVTISASCSNVTISISPAVNNANASVQITGGGFSQQFISVTNSSGQYSFSTPSWMSGATTPTTFNLSGSISGTSASPTSVTCGSSGGSGGATLSANCSTLTITLTHSNGSPAAGVQAYINYALTSGSGNTSTLSGQTTASGQFGSSWSNGVPAGGSGTFSITGYGTVDGSVATASPTTVTCSGGTVCTGCSCPGSMCQTLNYACNGVGFYSLDLKTSYGSAPFTNWTTTQPLPTPVTIGLPANTPFGMSMAAATTDGSLPPNPSSVLIFNGHTVNSTSLTINYGDGIGLAPGTYSIIFGYQPDQNDPNTYGYCASRITIASTPPPAQKEPYFQVYGADTLAGYGAETSTTLTCNSNANAGIVSWNKGSSSYAGAGDQFGAQANAAIQAFVSGAGTSGPLPGSLLFTNTTGGTGVYGGKYGNPAANCPPYLSGESAAPVGPLGVNLATNEWPNTVSSGSYVVNSNITIGGGGTMTIPAGKHFTLYVKGSVYIQASIAYAGSWGKNLTDIPSLTIVADGGNILLAPGISQLDGVYVADPNTSGKNGIFDTCAPNGSTYSLTGVDDPGGSTTIADACNTALNAHGSIIAHQIWFLRTKGDLTQVDQQTPAENLYYGPEDWLPAASGTAGNTPTGSGYDSIVGLPPAL